MTQQLPKNLSYCKTDEVANLKMIASKVRKSIIESLLEAESGHSAGSLGMADVFTALYFHVLNIDPDGPRKEDRDRVILSNGHICPVWYATMAHRGYFPIKELKKLRKFGSNLEGHPNNKLLEGVEVSSGSLGQGLSVALGMGLAAKMNEQDHRIYCLTGDGELNEGQIWEAAMYGGSKRINNVTWIIDRNNIQQNGYTEDLIKLEPLRQKLEAFGWYVIEIDGHNMEEIINACNLAKAIFERPAVIIAHTVPGKGIDFMEYKFEWHGKPPNKEQAKEALTQLRTLEGRIVCT